MDSLGCGRLGSDSGNYGKGSSTSLRSIGRFRSQLHLLRSGHNGLYEYGVPELILECELLAREIEYTLVKLDIEDEEVASFLNHLSRSLLRLRNSEPSYDDVKRLLNFLYPIHSHWSWLDGYVGRDPVGEMIARLN